MDLIEIECEYMVWVQLALTNTVINHWVSLKAVLFYI
jgi:hypothetical protein